MKIKPVVVEVKRTFKDDFDAYIKDISLTARPASIKNFESSYKNWLAGRWKTSEDVTIDSIQELVHDMVEKGRSGNTIRNVLAPLKVFIDIKWKDIKVPDMAKKRTFNWKMPEIKKLTKAMRDYERTFTNTTQIGKGYQMKGIFEFLLRGRRVNEVLTLKYSDIDFEAGIYTIRAENSKSGSDQEFTLDEALISKIPEQKSDFLFDTSAVTVRRHFALLLKDLKLPSIHVHDIRHMVATTALNSGAQIADVSRMLGHSNIRTTEERYVTKTAEMASRASATFLEALDG